MRAGGRRGTRHRHRRLSTWRRLGAITIPTLITSGHFDECTPLQAEHIHQAISDSEWVLFAESSHVPHVEEAVRYQQVLDDFLTRVEARNAG